MPVPVLAILLTAQAMAQPPACAAAAPPPPALATWSNPAAITAAVALSPVASVRYAVAPGHPVAAGSFGGIVTIAVATAGRYQVAVGEGAWVDIVAGGHSLASVAHGHGPACSGIRKIVSFDLAPGRYAIQLSGAPSATVRLLVVRQPG